MRKGPIARPAEKTCLPRLPVGWHDRRFYLKTLNVALNPGGVASIRTEWLKTLRGV